MANTQQAIELVEEPTDGAVNASIGFTSADLSGSEDMIAAPGSGEHIFVRKIVLTSVAAENLDIGIGGTSAPATIYFPDIQVAHTAGVTIDFNPYWWRLPVNDKLVIDADDAGVVSGFIIAKEG